MVWFEEWVEGNKNLRYKGWNGGKVRKIVEMCEKSYQAGKVSTKNRNKGQMVS